MTELGKISRYDQLKNQSRIGRESAELQAPQVAVQVSGQDNVSPKRELSEKEKKELEIRRRRHAAPFDCY